MISQLLQFMIMIGLGMLYRLLFLASTRLAHALKIKVVFYIIDFMSIGICATISAFFMIYFAERVAFFLCCAIILGFIICDIIIDILHSKKLNAVTT
jgi:hypothetical protein